MTCIALALLALMVQTEAGSESYEGKVAVAYVAVNRAEMSGRSLQSVLTQFRQFKLDTRLAPSDETLAAARTAFYRRVPDPTHGADHFLNRSLERRFTGTVPKWYNERYATVTIGVHTFLKLGGF